MAGALVVSQVLLQMTQLDEHGRPMMSDTTYTETWRQSYAIGYFCAHGWITFKRKSDGDHKICALCGVDLGLWNYYATNTPPKRGYA